MAVDKILKGMLDDFSRNTHFVDIADSKKYEYLVNKLVITKYAPEAFSDVGDIENVDVDVGDLFGIDAIAFVINGNLVFSKDDIEKYAISKRLDVEVIFIQTKTESDVNSGSVLKFSEAVKFFCDDIDKFKSNGEVLIGKNMDNLKYRDEIKNMDELITIINNAYNKHENNYYFKLFHNILYCTCMIRPLTREDRRQWRALKKRLKRSTRKY